VLEALGRSTKTEVRMRDRARIVLLAAEGVATREIGRIVGCTTGTASKWRVRYARARLAGLDETGHRGAAPKYGPAEQKRILAMLDQPPPDGYANWTAPLLARALGDVHEQYIWRFLRARKIDLSGRKSWCESNDPEFVAKAAEIVGLYMAPPENAVVLSVDEKPSIQALERAQGYLKLPTGRALIGQSHDYKRHGTTTLFAALEVATGKVTDACYPQHRHQEFLNQVAKAYPRVRRIAVEVGIGIGQRPAGTSSPVGEPDDADKGTRRPRSVLSWPARSLGTREDCLGHSIASWADSRIPHSPIGG